MTGTAAEGDQDKTLEDYYAELRQKWHQAEHSLQALQIPVAVSVRIKMLDAETLENPFPQPYCHDLGFIKLGNKWRVCYGSYPHAQPKAVVWIPITRCSLQQQVEAAEQFPELRRRLHNAATDYAKKVAQAVDFLETTLPGEMGHGGGEKPCDGDSACEGESAPSSRSHSVALRPHPHFPLAKSVKGTGQSPPTV